ncbi:MAG: hypothetical protein AB1512_03390 [Thermodesulfobacteriota bacterium]
MRKAVIFFLCSASWIFLLGQAALSQNAGPAIVDFKVQPLYRAAKLTWNTVDGRRGSMAVQILRAETFEEGPYLEVEVVNLVPGKSAHEYVDKTMGTESRYYYKLVVKETGESHGPLAARPYFSPPATQRQPMDRQALLLALEKARR